jgi:molybdopterin converting factor small subunit
MDKTDLIDIKRGNFMPIITFNAFSFLQKKLKTKQIETSNVVMTVDQGISAKDLIQQLQLEPEDVGVVLINGRVASFDTMLQDNDRVALVPPVEPPGPYRGLLGPKDKNSNE